MESSIVKINNLLESLKNGDLSGLTREIVLLINEEVTRILSIKEEHSQKDIVIMGMVVAISNILYNNTSIDLLPLEDGVYDILLELYKKYNPDYQVGAAPIVFKDIEGYKELNKKTVSPGIVFVRPKETEDFLFIDGLSSTPPVTKSDFVVSGIKYDTNKRNTARDTSHLYPELVGTLDKAKFVLCSQAEEKGVLDDSNVSVLERDFFAKHIKNGIITPNQKFGMVLELKYDGVSVEAEVSDCIHSARSRGDTNEGLGADITHILKNYRFPHASGLVNSNDIFGMKFEAIMTYDNLLRYNMAKGKEYKNCRTAITSIFASLDGEDYSDYITLIPLATSLDDVDRLTEIAFMNTFYSKGEYLRYAVIHGDYKENLFMIKKFAEEAEFMRNILPFMYDGIVVSYLDDDIKEKLGRYNSVNLYSIAVKFNPLKKQSIFRGYSYKVGQDGSITPMIHYDPVEFYGTIHDKSSGHSYDRFKQLNLKLDDVISIEYVNDVMPYVYKEDLDVNRNNPNPVVEFITKCPSCGSNLVPSESGKAMFCPNMRCPERNISRMVGMLKKLNLRDFAEESLRKIARFSFKELMEIKKEDVAFLGDINSQKLIDQLDSLRVNPIYDYRIVGALGFTGIAIEKWKLIMSKYTLADLMSMNHDELRLVLTQIKGIGPNTVETIIQEMDFYRDDLNYILSMNNVMCSKNAVFNGKIIRFTGFRDKELCKKLCDMGHDAGEGGVTKATDILLIPYEGFKSSKISRCGENTLIVPVEDFVNNLSSYL